VPFALVGARLDFDLSIKGSEATICPARSLSSIDLHLTCELLMMDGWYPNPILDPNGLACSALWTLEWEWEWKRAFKKNNEWRRRGAWGMNGRFDQGGSNDNSSEGIISWLVNEYSQASLIQLTGKNWGLGTSFIVLPNGNNYSLGWISVSMKREERSAKIWKDEENRAFVSRRVDNIEPESVGSSLRFTDIKCLAFLGAVESYKYQIPITK